MPDADVLIVGAGLAGLSCARELVAAGLRVLVLERSSMVGGRCASKAPDTGVLADFGPGFVHGDDPEFLDWVESWGGDLLPGWPGRVWGSGAPCQPRALNPEQKRYGLPGGIRSLAEAAAQGLEVLTNVEVTSLHWEPGEVQVVAADRRFTAHHGVLAVALDQARGLLKTLGPGPGSAAFRTADALLGQFSTSPCLTVLAHYAEAPDLDWDVWYPETSALLALSNETSKRGAPGAGVTLVVQGRPGWSAQRMDSDRDVWTRELLAEAALWVGPWVTQPTSVRAHRWKYARLGPSDHLVQPLLLADALSTAQWGLAGDLFDPDGGLQGAWRSGRRLAARMLTGLTPSNPDLLRPLGVRASENLL